jgi:abortive infection bacteriophage resistance protein
MVNIASNNTNTLGLPGGGLCPQGLAHQVGSCFTRLICDLLRKQEEEKALLSRAFFLPIPSPMENFTKKALPSRELVAKLEARGLLVTDAAERDALFDAVRVIGYYRLTGFCLPFQDIAPVKGQFHQGTTVAHVLRLYAFDTELRALCGKALEKIEVSLRVGICDSMARNNNDPHWYVDSRYFVDGNAHSESIRKAAKSVDFDFGAQRCEKLLDDPAQVPNIPKFLDHYYRKYDNPKMPPCWMLSECADFGYWSKMYRNLEKPAQQRIADSWTFPNKEKIEASLLSDWLWALSIFRNRCAHHTKITHRHFPFAPLKPRTNECKDLFVTRTSDLRTLLLVAQLLLKTCTRQSTWSAELHALFTRFSDVNITKATGFGSGKAWTEDPFWTL